MEGASGQVHLSLVRMVIWQVIMNGFDDPEAV